MCVYKTFIYNSYKALYVVIFILKTVLCMGDEFISNTLHIFLNLPFFFYTKQYLLGLSRLVHSVSFCAM